MPWWLEECVSLRVCVCVLAVMDGDVVCLSVCPDKRQRFHACEWQRQRVCARARAWKTISSSLSPQCCSQIYEVLMRPGAVNVEQFHSCSVQLKPSARSLSHAHTSEDPDKRADSLLFILWTKTHKSFYTSIATQNNSRSLKCSFHAAQTKKHKYKVSVFTFM